MATISRRLMHPPDVGGESRTAVDPEEEQREADGDGHSQRSVPRQALRPEKTQRPHGRRRQPGLRQGNAQRVVRARDAHVAAGDPDGHGPGAGGDGRLPARPARLGPLVRQLRALVQPPGRPGLFRRRGDQRARAGDAGTALDHRTEPLANPVGQDVLQPAGVDRAHQFPDLADPPGVGASAGNLLERHVWRCSATWRLSSSRR